MTESVQATDPAAAHLALQGNFDAIDLLARYRHEDEFNIFQFGQQLDSLANVTPECSQAVRKIAYTFDEPDTKDEAFKSTPSFPFPEAMERYKFLQEAPSLSDYFNLSQSQSQSLHQSQSQASSIGPPPSFPPPNQEHSKQQEKQQETTQAQSKRKRELALPPNQQQSSSARVPSRLRVPARSPSSSSGLAPRRSPRAEVPRADLKQYVTDMRTRTSPGLSGGPDDSEESDIMESPQRQRTKRQRLNSEAGGRKAGEETHQAEDEDRTENGSTGTKKGKEKLSTSRPFRPTAEEIAQMEKASEIPNNSSVPIGRVLGSSKAPVLRGGPSTLSRGSQQQEHSNEQLASTSVGKAVNTRSSQQTSLKLLPTRPMQRPGKMYEGNILLSGPAQTSKMGMPLTGGYNGFKFFRTWIENGVKKEKWTCQSCGNSKHYTIKSGHNTNLNAHRDKCPNWPRDKNGKPLIIDELLDDEVEIIEAGAQQAVRASRSGLKSSALTISTESTTLGSSSYRGPSLTGWISGQQISHPLLTRRLGLVMVIENSLPFSHLKSPRNVAMVKSIDARATKSLKSGHTVRRDLDQLYAGIKNDVYNELQSIDTLVSLQHDAWTTRSYQHSFLAIIASYVTSSWEYRELLLAFDVVKAKHTGGTFSGHVIRLLIDYTLDEKWYGPVVSDSTGVNHRMLNMLSYDITRKSMQQRNPHLQLDADDQAAAEKSCSAFPRATQRKEGHWNADHNKILCLNHHINLAIRAGFAKMGVKIQNRIRRKVLENIRPGPIIQVTDESGNLVDVDLPDLDDEDSEDGEGVVVQTRKVVKGKGKGKKMSKEKKDIGQEEESSSDEETMDESAYDYEPDMEPDPDELESDDEGGPLPPDPGDATPAPTTASSPPQGAISKLEAFVTAIHRGDQRRSAFREEMEKEYHRDPEKAGLPFPSKPNATRWNSHYSMIKGAMKIREAIDSHCRLQRSKTEKFGQYLLTDAQWRQLELLRPVLRLAGAVTKKMERAEGNLYMVLDHHASLRDEVEELAKTIEDDDNLDVVTARELRAFCKAVADKLKKYRDLALGNRLILAAAVLHPLNRLELFETSYPKHQVKAEEALRALLKELVGSSEDGINNSRPTASKTSPPPPPPSPLSAARARRKAARNSEQRDGPDEVAKYLDIGNCPWRDSDKSPYKWWKDNEAVFPNIAKLARLVLGIPGSSSSVERVFSQAALFTTNHRARLDANSISQLVTTKLWLRNGADELVGLDEDVRRAAQSIAALPDFA